MTGHFGDWFGNWLGDWFGAASGAGIEASVDATEAADTLEASATSFTAASGLLRFVVEEEKRKRKRVPVEARLDATERGDSCEAFAEVSFAAVIADDDELMMLAA